MNSSVQTSLLEGFVLERILNEDAKIRSASLLGHFIANGGEKEAALILLEKTHFSTGFYENIGAENNTSSLSRAASLGSNDVYTWMLGWMSDSLDTATGSNSVANETDAHVKVTLIRPASEAHIAKYSEQRKVMVTETPDIYRTVVEPWIKSQPIARIQWVYNILDKKKEAETILFEKAGREQGYIIVPDLKWDRKTLSSLYLIAIVQDRSLRSIRDLTKQHIPLLEDIREQGEILAKNKFGLRDGDKGQMGKLRCFLHYQPTYYHMHLHMLSSDYISHPGAIVGQAHLLEDVIDLLQLGVNFKDRTLTYSLGEQSSLLSAIRSQAVD